MVQGLYFLPEGLGPNYNTRQGRRDSFQLHLHIYIKKSLKLVKKYIQMKFIKIWSHYKLGRGKA
jgi:hypothetical protein